MTNPAATADKYICRTDPDSPNDRPRLTLSAEARALVRAAVRKSPDWPAYRDQKDIDMSDLTTKESLIDVCDDLGIDAAAIISGGPQAAAPPPPKAKEAAPPQTPPLAAPEPTTAPTAAEIAAIVRSEIARTLIALAHVMGDPEPDA